MFHTIWVLIKAAAVVVVAALIMFLLAYGGYIIEAVLWLFAIGVATFVILHKPVDSDEP